MPHKDPERKRAYMREWRKLSIARGYGKWLYARRKLRFDDAVRFRTAIERALDELANEPLTAEATPVSNAIAYLSEALNESEAAEAELGLWEADQDDEAVA